MSNQLLCIALINNKARIQKKSSTLSLDVTLLKSRGLWVTLVISMRAMTFGCLNQVWPGPGHDTISLSRQSQWFLCPKLQLNRIPDCPRWRTLLSKEQLLFVPSQGQNLFLCCCLGYSFLDHVIKLTRRFNLYVDRVENTL